MAKVIKYRFLASPVTQGAEALFLEKTVSWSEGNEKMARQEAVDGVYAIEDNGLPVPAATTEDVMNVLLGVTE